MIQLIKSREWGETYDFVFPTGYMRRIIVFNQRHWVGRLLKIIYKLWPNFAKEDAGGY